MDPERGTLRVMVVDDEALARDLLREHLSAHPDVRIVALCANGFEAVRAATETKPDLLLLDIQMPKLDGFEVLELLGGDVPVIFVTAYDEHALRAFEVHAVDYLLKPVAPERLAEALARARSRLALGDRAPLRSLRDLVAATRSGGRFLERILVRDASRVHVLPVDTVDHIEARDDCIAVRAGGQTHLKPQTLAEIEALLDPARFVRIHRSYILNVDRLAKIELYAKDSRVAILKDGTKLPVSRAGYARLRELL